MNPLCNLYMGPILSLSWIKTLCFTTVTIATFHGTITMSYQNGANHFSAWIWDAQCSCCSDKLCAHYFITAAKRIHGCLWTTSSCTLCYCCWSMYFNSINVTLIYETGPPSRIQVISSDIVCWQSSGLTMFDQWFNTTYMVTPKGPCAINARCMDIQPVLQAKTFM